MRRHNLFSNLSHIFLQQKHYDHINPSSTKSHFQLRATYKKRRNFYVLKKKLSPFVILFHPVA